MRVEGLGSVVRSKPRGVDGAEESPDGILWSSTFGTLVGAEELLKATAVECERGVLPAELGARIERVAAVVWCDPRGVNEAEDIPADSASSSTFGTWSGGTLTRWTGTRWGGVFRGVRGDEGAKNVRDETLARGAGINCVGGGTGARLPAQAFKFEMGLRNPDSNLDRPRQC